MRELIKTGAYSFVDGTRQITITDGRSFTASDILLIINETQKVVLVSSMQKDNLISVVANVVTYSNSLPALANGDVLNIQIDFPIPTGLSIISDYDNYRTKVAAAATLKGQAATASDTGDQISEKIKAISTSIIVDPIQGNPTNYHDLATEVANFADVENPYAIAILLREDFKNIYLSGASKYKTSDGQIHTGSPGLYTIGANSDASKKTNYIIYRFPTISADLRFGSNFSTVNYSKDILQAYIYGLSYNAISFINCTLSRLFLESSAEIPYVISGTRTALSLPDSAFQGTKLMRYTFPSFRSDAINAEKTITIPAYCFASCSLEEIFLPDGLLYLTVKSFAFSGAGIITLTVPQNCYATFEAYSLQNNSLRLLKFKNGSSCYMSGNSGTFGALNLTNDCDVIFESGMANLFISIYQYFGVNLGNMYIGIPLTAPTITVTGVNLYTTINKITLENGWNWTFNMAKFALPVEGTMSFKTNVLDKLIDYRADGVTTPTITANGTSTITIVNGNCTKVHRPGDTIYVNAVAKVIQTVIDDTHLQLTTTVATASGLSYGSGKIITLLAALKTSMTTDYPNWATDVAAKGWTVA